MPDLASHAPEPPAPKHSAGAKAPIRSVGALLLLLLIAGCGTRGPLYLVDAEGKPRRTESMPGLRAPVP